MAVAATLLSFVSGCSDDTTAAPTGQSGGDADKPAVTTIELTVGGESVDLSGTTQKCYDHDGHLMVEAYNADDPDASHFLVDSHQGTVTLSIGVQDGPSGVFEDGKDGQSAEVTRNGDSVSVTGTIEADPLTIDADCAEFVDTPPDSSKVDSSQLPSIPSSCPAGQAVCIPEN